MKNKKILLIFLFVFMMLPSKVYAMRPGEFANRKECDFIELADAKEDGSLEKIQCFEKQDYAGAKAKMNELESNNLVIIENGMIIDAKYGVIDYNVDLSNTRDGTIHLYDSGKSIGYIKTAGNKADDAVIIDFSYTVKENADYGEKKVKVKVAGLVGWIDQYEGSTRLYEVVPFVWVKSPQFYKVTKDNIRHYLPENVYDGITGSTYNLVLDKKPEMLNEGDYFSYDGHYFYTDFKTMVNDYKAGNYNNSVNKDKPYYNYYQYVSFRTKTNYNATNINDFINMRTGSANITNSMLTDTGDIFIWVQEHYGVNALAMLSIGINESGTGTSRYARERYNLFGLNAYDSNPDNAERFDSIEDGIKEYGYKWMSYWYLQPGDWHFSGANLGNKQEGLLVKYASDPFWSEKAARYYYEMDSIYGFQDRNNYVIAVLNDNYNDKVYAYKSVNGVKIRDSFQYKLKDTPVVVKETLKDSNGNVWYKIQSDPNLDSNLNDIGDSKSNPRYDYNWDAYVYVEGKYFNIVINPEDYNPTDVTNVDSENKPIKTVSSVIKDANYKYDNGMIFGIELGTTIESITGNLMKQGIAGVNVVDVNGNTKTTGIIVTGDKINIIIDEVTTAVNVVIYGDINGDGIIDKTDCAEILRQYYGYISYESAKHSASDINHDGKIDKIDASQILRQYYGYANIEQ